MGARSGQGDFIGGEFVRATGEPLVSHDPATGEVVLEGAWSSHRATDACDAADAALAGWRSLTISERFAHLVRFREAIVAATESIAEAISLEMGKLRTEARTEVASLVGRFDLIAERIRTDMPEGALRGHPLESLRHRPHGVVAVIGPFNFPLHLCHAHVVPALLLGNTVVMKPSEITPLSGERYAEAARAAGLPPGVLNVVHGAGGMGAALLADRRVRALCFTGSWPTGRRILEATLDRPEVLVALEMGGKNTSVVLDDADIRQAAHEVVVGKYLTTGQRCTCTDRVLVHQSKRKALIDALIPMVNALRFGTQDDSKAFAGPLASIAAKKSYETALQAARAGGAVERARGQAPEGNAFAVPTLFELPDGLHVIDGYTNHELFGPNLHLETFASDDEAIALIRSSMVPLATSVFTRDEKRFDRVCLEIDAGIVNLNRSTNQASPRLPFGGTGTAGNFRPAGSHAPRNLAVAVAVQRKVSGALVPDPKLKATLVAPDLDALEAQHGMEECKEAARTLLNARRPMSPRLPKGGKLPASEAWLERLYGEGRMPVEKKPGVVDHLRSSGPWMVSVDDEPLAVLDAMSQTATIPAGFAQDEVVRHYAEGGFEDALVASDDTSVGEHRFALAYSDFLKTVVPGLPHVTFTSSGAEANEKAYALAMLHRASPSARKLLAFEGSFHGRTMLSLQASHSPAKRAPFEIKGYEVSYAPYPAWWTPQDGEPTAPDDYFERIAGGGVDSLVTSFGQADRLLADELRSLAEVERHVASGEYFAVVIEPMQSEGGDRYATARFHRALRLLTRRYGVPLIYDEVQTGFGLGGTFAWHHRFGLCALDGTVDVPDALIFAKRAQVGIVMSRFPDPEPTSAHPASLVRGLIHARSVAVNRKADDVERIVRERLAAIATKYPDLVSHTRATGYALAFDLPSPEHMNRYLNQRFWRGAVAFAAGTRTVRYRLSRAYGPPELDVLFDAVDRSLAWIHANPGVDPPAWLDLAHHTVELEADRDDVRVRMAAPDEVDRIVDEVLALEARVYEPARQDTPATLRMAFEEKEGIPIVAEALLGSTWRVIGSAFAVPLERVADVEGPANDPMLGKENSAYSIAITMDPEWQGIGLGRKLKSEQIRAARDAKRPDGSLRYEHLTGRNRVGHTAAMGRINRSYGAYEVLRLEGQYGDPDGQSSYYRIPLRAVAPVRGASSVPIERLDVASGLARPFRTPPASLMQSESAGMLYGPAVHKLTIVNYVTPAIVRAVEYVAGVVHRFPHFYFTSSRDEAFDKTVRALRLHRKNGQVAIGVDGGYLGHTSAAARSLSDPAVHRQGPAYFDHWLRVPHPETVGPEAFRTALTGAIEKAGGAENVLGLFVEPLQERTGRVLSPDAARALDEVRTKTGVPLVFAETASGYFRSGQGAFYSDALSVEPDVLLWWSGGQQGFVHVSSRYYVASPLTLVSTWDGDELSLVRVHHQLRAARRVDVQARAKELDAALEPVRKAGLAVRGVGLYRTIEVGERAFEWSVSLSHEEVRARAFPNGVLQVAPSLDFDAKDYERLRRALLKVMG